MEESTNIIPSTKKKRGRPSRKENTVKTNTGDPTMVFEGTDEVDSERNVIVDPLLSPYKIYASDVQYTVVDEVRPEGALLDKTYGYYTSLGYALMKIARLKMVKNKQYSLKEYVTELEAMLNKFHQTFNK